MTGDSSERPHGAVECRPAVELWGTILAQIPTLFGRLVYLSVLRNENTGRYEHDTMSLAFGEHQTDQVLHESHEEIFEDWLSFDLEQQKVDLDRYLSTFEIDMHSVLETWLRSAPYRSLVPASVGVAERQLYLTDLETLLKLLMNEYGISDPASDP